MLKIKENWLTGNHITVTEEILTLFCDMSLKLNRETLEVLKSILTGKKSILEMDDFVKTFEGNAKQIAIYNLYLKTKNFARENLWTKEAECIFSMQEVEDECNIEILYKGIKILLIKITEKEKQLIKFKLYRSQMTFDSMMSNLQCKIKSLQRLINIGNEGLEDINEIFENYVEYMKISDCDSEKTSFYDVEIEDIFNIL